MQIFIKNLEVKYKPPLTIDASLTLKIREVKKRIEDKEGIPWNRQILMYEKQILEDGK